jgi:hypothetical protein
VEQPVEAVSKSLVDGREQVPVRVEPDGDRAVAQSFHDRPAVGSFSNQECRAPVSQVMEAQTSRKRVSPFLSASGRHTNRL